METHLHGFTASLLYYNNFIKLPLRTSIKHLNHNVNYIWGVKNIPLMKLYTNLFEFIYCSSNISNPKYKTQIPNHSFASIIQPRQYIPLNNLNILISFSKQQRMHHTIINLQSLVFTLGLLIQFSAHIWISHSICTTMNDNEWNTHITQTLTHIICNSQKLRHSTQSWFPIIPLRVHTRNDFLLRNLHRLVQKISCWNNRQSGCEFGEKSENFRNRPSGFDFIRDFTHGCH